MRISISKACLGFAFTCIAPAPVFAEQAYLCAINEVYECVAVTGCSRISLEDANLAGVMLIDVEKKQLSSAPLGQDPSTDAIDSVTVADDAILLHGIGKKDTNRTWSAVISLKTGNLSAGVSTPNSSLALAGDAPPNFDASSKAFLVVGHLDHRVENSKVMPSRAPKPWGTGVRSHPVAHVANDTDRLPPSGD